MSVKNKTKDRDESGKIIRKFSVSNWVQSTPSWWAALKMNHPRRRENRKLCKQIIKGASYDDLVFPLGNRKPHEYYW